MNFLDGEILYIDKPLGWTSFNVVSRVRNSLSRRMGIRRLKVGHAGTLDPLATGVMIVCTGRAPQNHKQLPAGVKEYIATIALGATTPSFDRETEIDATYPTGHITEELVRATLGRFVGTIEQVPPAYSACKVDGKRAYALARKGKDVELKPKILVVDSIELLSFAQDSIEVRVVCGKGTYIRALARDIGQALGSGAHLTALRRTRVGDALIENCLTVDQVAELIRTTDIEMPQQPD